MELDKIETEHLIGNRIQQDDLGLLYRMYTNDEVMYPIGGTKIFREVKMIHQEMMDHWEKYDFGIYIFRNKETGEFAGRGGLKKIIIEGKEEIELIYALMPQFWGKGLATEIANKSIEVGFEQLNLKEIISLMWTENKTSQRTMEKLGFKNEKTLNLQELPHVLYRRQ